MDSLYSHTLILTRLTNSTFHSLTQTSTHSSTSTHSPTHIYSLSSTHPLTQYIYSLTHWINQSHPLVHSPTSTNLLIQSLTHSSKATHLITHSILVLTIQFNCEVDSVTYFIPFRFISVHSDTFYKVSRVLENVFLAKQNRQHVAKNRN